MRFLYQTGINIYWFLIRAMSLFNHKAYLFIQGRKNWKTQLTNQRIQNEKYWWVHCASLGEFEQARPVIEIIKEKHPDLKLCLSFFSPSGYEIRKHYELADIVMYLPKDSAKNAMVFLQILKPEFSVFIKYEFWFHYLHTLSKLNIPTFLLSAIFRENQIFFKPWGGFFRNMLNYYQQIFVQDEYSLTALQNIGIKKVSHSGDTRFDRVIKVASTKFEHKDIAHFTANSMLIVAGSTWPQDENFLVEIMKQRTDIKLIIAPHEINSQHIEQIESAFHPFGCTKLSRIKEKNTSDYKVLIIDTIGLLSYIYRFGDIAYIGGGFGKGIHNLLEAACYNLPVIFGPNHLKFKEAIELKTKKAGFSFENTQELMQILHFLMDDGNLLKTGNAAGEYVKSKHGASTIFYQYLQKSDVFSQESPSN
jgi:3-deoxy-D-manno-octulosonic-acid transferase